MDGWKEGIEKSLTGRKERKVDTFLWIDGWWDGWVGWIYNGLEFK